MKIWRLVVSSVSQIVHSNATGASAIRGGATCELASGVKPTSASFTLGLLGMAEQAAIGGGVLTIESEVGKGTRVRASFPT